jgi:SAM-dependent methyltransferase
MTAASSSDRETATAFAESWNRLPPGSVYTREQFLDWFSPLDPDSFRGKDVLELGFGNGSLLVHMASFAPARLCGVELGETLETARRNVEAVAGPGTSVELHHGDLTRVDLGPFDLVYCIGVLHHLRDPDAGFAAVLRHARPGAAFHAWVYAREGNTVVRALVDPVRRVSSRLPWWITKYGVALPLVLPYFAYAKTLHGLRPNGAPRWLRPFLPLHDYSLWIASRGFGFFHHVAFDQLLTPTTAYLSRDTVDRWLRDESIEPGSTYVVFRNGNSWKLGGRKRN